MASMSLDDYAVKTLNAMFLKSDYNAMKEICVTENERLLESGFLDQDIKDFNKKILLLIQAKTVKATEAKYAVAEKVMKLLLEQ